MDVVLDVINEIRSIKTTYRVPPTERLQADTSGFSISNNEVLSVNTSSISRLANVDFRPRGQPLRALGCELGEGGRNFYRHAELV